MRLSQSEMKQTLDQLAKERQQGKITRASVDNVVAAFQLVTLDEAERQLSITGTNDVRQRSSYSKNRYYSRPTSKSVERRKKRVQKLLEHTHESSE